MVALRFATVNRKILISARHGSFSTYSERSCATQACSHAQPHPENECQQSVYDIWSCILGNMSGASSQTSTKQDMAICIGRYVRDILATSSRTVTTYFVYRATTSHSWGFWCIITVKTLYIDNNGHIALFLTMMDDQQSLTLCWRSFWRQGRKCFIFTFAYKAANNQFLIMCTLSPPRVPMIYDQQLLTLCWQSISWWGMQGIGLCFGYKGCQRFLSD